MLNDKEKKICSRCGKEIVGKVYLLTQSDPLNGTEQCYLCEDCCKAFKEIVGD